MSYAYRKTTSLSHGEAVSRVQKNLTEEGFGILCNIDVQASLKEKIGVSREPYTILGACNPKFANQALQAEIDIGLLLPCNVVVYECDGVVSVAAVVPTIAMQVVENDALHPIASEVQHALQRAIDAV